MMKKLLLGIAVCCGVSGMACEYANGMNSVAAIVSDIAEDPCNKTKLTTLVEKLTNEETGSGDTDLAIDVAQSTEVKEELKLDFEKIVCMIFGIAHDWCCGYKRMHSPEYYIEGAKTGKFGPYYNIPNDQNS